MIDFTRVLDVTDRIRDEVIQRTVGHAPDPRFDPVIDYLADLDESLTRDPGGPEPEIEWP